MITLASWDTEHFDIKVGNLTLEALVTEAALHQAVAQATAEGYDLLYLKDVTLEQEWLNDRWLLADEKVVYTQILSSISDAPSEVHSLLHHELTDDLLALSYESGKFSRYKLDKRLPTTVFANLYHAWIEKSLTGQMADDVLGVEKDGRVVGMLTYKNDGSLYDIGLVAVAPDQAGKGIGTQLMQALFRRLGAGAVVDVATQNAICPLAAIMKKTGLKSNPYRISITYGSNKISPYSAMEPIAVHICHLCPIQHHLQADLALCFSVVVLSVRALWSAFHIGSICHPLAKDTLLYAPQQGFSL